MEKIVGQLVNMLGKGDGLSNLSNAIGGSPRATRSALELVLPSMIHAMNRNTNSREGAGSLLNALKRDHDGSILESLGDAISRPDENAGMGILGHLFGSKTRAVESGVGRATGLDAGQITRLMVTVAPIVLGLLGKLRGQKDLDSDALSNLLGKEDERVRPRTKKRLSPLLQFLDQDGDGDVSGEVIRIGTGLLGRLFRR